MSRGKKELAEQIIPYASRDRGFPETAGRQRGSRKPSR